MQAWPDDEKQSFLQQVRKHTGQTPDARASADIGAGLRICSGGSCVDGTLTGILSDRRGVEAILLTELTQARPTPAGD